MSATQTDFLMRGSASSASQRARILRALQASVEVTHLYAEQHFGCTRLAARIQELRAEGWSIDTIWHSNDDKRWAGYRLRPQA